MRPTYFADFLVNCVIEYTTLLPIMELYYFNIHYTISLYYIYIYYIHVVWYRHIELIAFANFRQFLFEVSIELTEQM